MSDQQWSPSGQGNDQGHGYDQGQGYGSYGQGSYGQGQPAPSYGQGGYSASGWQSPGAPVDGPPPQVTGKGLFGALFDLSFRNFATPHIVKIVYILVMIAIGLGALFSVIAAFGMMANRQVAAGVVFLLATPVVALIYLALARMTMEMYVAICRSAEELSRIRDSMSRR